MNQTTSNALISIVVPVYNEALGLAYFHKTLVSTLKKINYKFEIIYVNDGSADNSSDVIRELAVEYPGIKPLNFARNFGKEMATTAGINHAAGSAVIVLDADGQHPVELIPEFIDKWENGAEVVIGVREANKNEGFVKKFGSKFFYTVLHLIGAPDTIPGSTDYRLIDRAVVEEFNSLTERNRITRALIDWLGFNKEIIYFTANAREFGDATYSFRKLFQLAMNGFVSLSFAPLYFSGYMGIVITLLSLVSAIFVTVEKYILQDPLKLNITGTAFLGLLILFLVGILLIGQGLMAVYIARIYSETQNRPLYITRKSK